MFDIGSYERCLLSFNVNKIFYNSNLWFSLKAQVAYGHIVTVFIKLRFWRPGKIQAPFGHSTQWKKWNSGLLGRDFRKQFFKENLHQKQHCIMKMTCHSCIFILFWTKFTPIIFSSTHVPWVVLYKAFVLSYMSFKPLVMHFCHAWIPLIAFFHKLPFLKPITVSSPCMASYRHMN